MANGYWLMFPFAFHLSPFALIARKAGIEPTLTVLETALLPLEDFRILESDSRLSGSISLSGPPQILICGEIRR